MVSLTVAALDRDHAWQVTAPLSDAFLHSVESHCPRFAGRLFQMIRGYEGGEGVPSPFSGAQCVVRVESRSDRSAT